MTHARKIYLSAIAIILLQTSTLFGQTAPKYIFFMIGDGMGLNQVNVTEVYKAAIQNRNTVFPLTFSQFPYTTFATSFSLSNGVTDSAAGGTALAVGFKTKNGVIGMDSAANESYKSIAYYAQEQGMKVGITTSVSIDHATPASFFARRANRSMYYEIGLDLISSNFDFFGGAGFLSPEKTYDRKDAPSLFPQFEKAGYTLAYGMDDYQRIKNNSEKIILMNNQGDAQSELVYAIDRDSTDLTLTQITAAAIESLQKNNDKGFFLMVEGGKIDWACHANDGATMVQEVLDFDQAVAEAFNFYKQHPTETLIIVTADHETGGLALGTGSSNIHLNQLASQRQSTGELSAIIRALRKQDPNASWTKVQEVIKDFTGIWGDVKISTADEENIRKAYESSFVNHQEESEKTLYANDDKLAFLAIKALNSASSLSWASTGHSEAYIPVYAIGNGAELFSHKMDNTDIPRKVAQAAGWAINDLSATEFQSFAKHKNNAVIVDVRTLEEFQTGHIAQAKHADVNDASFTSALSTLEKQTPIFVYCQAGGRSKKAMKTLQELGYENVYNLEGGMAAWQKANLPVEN